MKKKTITIGALLLAMNSFSQTDTLTFSISGKDKFKFDYQTSKIDKIYREEEYKDFKFKLKKNEFLILDLFDNIKRDTLYLLYRDVTAYYRDGYIDKLYFSSNSYTIEVDGSLVKKVIVHKPKLK